MNEEEESCIEELQQYAELTYSEELVSVMLAKDFRQHYSIIIDTMSLFESNITFAHLLFDCPEKALNLLDQAFLKAAYNVCLNRSIKINKANKVNLHVRLTALPNLPEIYRANLPNCSDVGQFMCISGTVIRATKSKVLEYRKAWRCTKCKFNFTIDAEVEQGYIFEKPSVCPNPEWCNGKSFTLLSTDVNPEFCKDYREVKIQQQFNTLSVGSVPKSMWVILENDLVETCQPGNDVNISGVLIQRWKPLVKGCFIDIDLVLYAHNVEVKNKMTPGILSESAVAEFGKFWIDHQTDPLRGRDFILSSICPQVFGLYVVKLAVALVLAGGVEKKDGNSRIRGDSHLLMVGDPGTGKSQFLKFASKVCMRSVLTSGIGTTNAGLTVSAVKESGRWQLEAGALVLADGGVCCIDEFSCIKEQDKTCIHEAMEQQTISVAKAGLVCSLSSKCSIVAATNPKGKYDENLSLSENTALASPLLSRFDIILVLLDSYDEDWDKLVSSYILSGRELSSQFSKESLWSLEKMRNYFNFIRNINPKVSASCDRVLQTYYQRQRGLEGRNYARTTPRLLQSLIRLAEGHARLMFRTEALVIDAIMAIVLMESSMSGSAILDELTTLHTSFSEDPKAEYKDKAQAVLNLLNLEELLGESGDYRLAYQDLSVKSLLSKVSVLCDTSKNSYLGDSFGLNENTTVDYTKSTNISPKNDVADIFKKLLPLKNKVCLEDTSINITTNGLESQKEINISPEKCSEKLKKIQSFNKVGNLNEVSTMSDLFNTFCNEGFQPQDTTLDVPEKKLAQKRKPDDSVNVLATKNSPLDQDDYLDSLAMDIDLEAAETPELNLRPQAKVLCVEKPKSTLQSFKQFSFQQSSRKSFIPKVMNPNEASDKGNTAENSNKVENLPGNSTFFNKTSTEHTKTATTSSSVLAKDSDKAANLPGTSKTINKAFIKNTKIPATSSRVMLDQSSLSNAKDGSASTSGTEKSSDIPLRTENNSPSVVATSSSSDSNKFADKLKVFAFKGRPSKKETKTTPPKTSEITKQSAPDTTSKVSSQSAERDRGTQSSQSVFKRIFPSFVAQIDDEDLDDPMFNF